MAVARPGDHDVAVLGIGSTAVKAAVHQAHEHLEGTPRHHDKQYSKKKNPPARQCSTHTRKDAPCAVFPAGVKHSSCHVAELLQPLLRWQLLQV